MLLLLCYQSDEKRKSRDSQTNFISFRVTFFDLVDIIYPNISTAFDLIVCDFQISRLIKEYMEMIQSWLENHAQRQLIHSASSNTNVCATEFATESSSYQCFC